MYAWALVPLLGGCAALGVLARPATTPITRPLDFALLAAVAACAIQLMPLPRAGVALLSPARLRIEDALALGSVASWIPLTVAPADTIAAAAIFAAAALMYGAARRVFESGGVRHVCRTIAWIGLALACVAIVQRAVGGNLVYGFWRPLETGATPYGPFINRNHCATWLLMAIPLCFGYLFARLRGERPTAASAAASLKHSVDPRTLWLAIAGTAMILALVVSLSRSGIAAFLIVGAAGAARLRARLDRVRGLWLIAIAALGFAVVLVFADPAAVVGRFSETLAGGRAGRLEIWRDTVPMVRDFWLTGAGAGAYQVAMGVYQTGDRTYYFNQAHNEYLQAAAEGGLLLCAPLAVAVIALVRAARRQLKEDASGVFWIRAGAAAGLAAVAVQSVWETGLRIPANALLAAVLAAIVTHQLRSPSAGAGAEGWR